MYRISQLYVTWGEGRVFPWPFTIMPGCTLLGLTISRECASFNNILAEVE